MQISLSLMRRSHPVAEEEGLAGIEARLESMEGPRVVDQEDLAGIEMYPIRRGHPQLGDKGVQMLVRSLAPEPRREEHPVAHAEGVARDRAALGIAIEGRAEAHGGVAKGFLRALG